MRVKSKCSKEPYEEGCSRSPGAGDNKVVPQGLDRSPKATGEGAQF
jgi:hypothetical protein